MVSDFTKLTLDSKLMLASSFTLRLYSSSLARISSAIALCTFSYRFNSFYSTDPPPFVEAMARSLKQSGSRIRRLPGTGFLYGKQDQKYQEDIKLQHHIADEVCTICADAFYATASLTLH